MENNVGFGPVDHSSGNYAHGLGISEEKAALLMQGVLEIGNEDLLVTQKLEYVASLCDNQNELVFSVFKLGELSGYQRLRQAAEKL